MSPLNNIHDQRNDKRTHEQNHRPIEILGRHRDTVRPEGPKEDECDVNDTDGVHCYTPAAETPACSWDQLRVCDASVENAAH
jgi:hypothetical protein